MIQSENSQINQTQQIILDLTKWSDLKYPLYQTFWSKNRSMQNIFSKFEVDGTGRIDRFELQVVLELNSYKEMGQKVTEEELFAMINKVDESNTGKIEFY